MQNIYGIVDNIFDSILTPSENAEIHSLKDSHSVTH